MFGAIDCWECACGFKNKPSNQVCGGLGPLGCKTPRPEGGMAPSWNFGSVAAVQGAQEWVCSVCGFRNKGMNKLCGGTGPMGCKTPKPSGGGDLSADFMQQLNSDSFGPVRRAKTGGVASNPYEKDLMSLLPMMGFANPFMAFANMGLTGGMGQQKLAGAKHGAKEQGNWKCVCGFSNKASNVVCGGANGTLGCKLPREWSCGNCGFVNKNSNLVCGGVGGNMGCKAPRPSQEQLLVQGALAQAGAAADPFKAWRTGGKAANGWDCPACGFKNQSSNTVCGGAGPLGCKAPRPNDWLCGACNFQNKASNDVCGGAGPLGCKTPKPIGAKPIAVKVVG
mmetsp:Transcript_23531/g.44391  ORF Transcript_23531/g.44391 Transcript_23531/m.44391 type:complete len:337 (-) Transcript_23531:48-1058(-)